MLVGAPPITSINLPKLIDEVSSLDTGQPRHPGSVPLQAAVQSQPKNDDRVVRKGFLCLFTDLLTHFLTPVSQTASVDLTTSSAESWRLSVTQKWAKCNLTV